MPSPTSLRKAGVAVTRRSSSNQAAVTTTIGAALSAISGGESPTEAEHNAVITQLNLARADILALTTLVNELRTIVVNAGLAKGS
jgi:hypothetical protein